MDVKEFKDNPLWGVVGEAQTLAKGLDPDIAAELTERVNGVATWVNRFRGLADTRMFTASMLGTSQQQWIQLNNYLASIANSSGYVQHANNQLDAITTTTAGEVDPGFRTGGCLVRRPGGPAGWPVGPGVVRTVVG